MKTIYELGLFEEYILHHNDSVEVSMKRVPGGWLYLYTNPVTSLATFIPFNNEFQYPNRNIPYSQ